MELWETKIDTVASLTLPFDETIIMPIGDVQYGAQGSDIDRLKRDLDWGMKHNAYFLGMGEFLDVASPSNRQKLKSIELYDSVEDALEDVVSQQIGNLYNKVLKGTEGRWLGLLEGHHFYEFRDGNTTDTKIASLLKSPFLGTCAFVRVRLKSSSGKSLVTCVIWCHHGLGSGQKVSAPLNKLENLMPYFNADIYLIGHQHKKVGAPIDQLYMTQRRPYRIRYRTKIIACTGGYLRGYLQGATQGRQFPRGSYVERGMRTPVSLGCVLLYVRPVKIKHDGEDYWKLDLNVAL